MGGSPMRYHALGDRQELLEACQARTIECRKLTYAKFLDALWWWLAAIGTRTETV